ncbi:MAG: septum formation initiator family protein [Lachnospiraceae bacterium]|nr:septum formation initiator family protein [Lachnospiraceae bacterium]
MGEKILIRTEQILEAREEIKSLKQRNDELKARIEKLKSSLEWQVGAKEGINDNLSSICAYLEKQSNFLENATALCGSVVSSTEETNNTLIAAISALMLSILGISVVTAGKYLIVTDPNGNVTVSIINTGTESTDVNVIPDNEQASDTKQYVNGAVNYKGHDYSNYKVASCYDESKVLSQTDKKWKSDLYIRNKDGSLYTDPDSKKCPVNGGCCVTSEAMAYNMKHPDAAVTPLQCNNGTGEEPHRGNSFAYFTGEYYSNEVPGSKGVSAAEQRKMIYTNISNNEPTLVRTDWGHTVTAIGIREGADPNNLTNADILVMDPSGGKVKTLQEACYHNSKQYDINTNWALYTPK